MNDSLDQLPVWLINLPRAAKRRAKMVSQLDTLKIDFTLFDGVDGKARAREMLDSVDTVAFERNMGREVLLGGIGCYQSHLGVWREFLKTDASIALVLEDDVAFHDTFTDALRHGLDTQAHWDILKLNCIRAKLPVSQGRGGPFRLNAYIGAQTGTGAYLIKRETAQKLLNVMLPITRATDHEINRFYIHDYRLRGLEPFPSHIDDDNFSQITGDGYLDVRKFPRHRRLPHYRLKAMNYLRRFWWLLRRGEIFPRNRDLRAEWTDSVSVDLEAQKNRKWRTLEDSNL